MQDLEDFDSRRKFESYGGVKIWYNISTYKRLLILRVLRGEMIVKKKQILASLIMLSLLQGNAYAAFDYVVTEDTEWPYVLGQSFDGKPQGNRTVMANDTLTIKNGATVYLDYEKTTFYYDISFINSYDYDQKIGGYIAGDVKITGGNIELIGPATQINVGIYNEETYSSNITLDGTNLSYKNLQVGVYAQNGQTQILNNDYTKFENAQYGIAAENNAEVTINSNNFIVNSENHDFESTAISSEGNSKVDVRSGATLFYGNVSAYDNGNINFQKDETFDSQSVAIYSDKADAVSGESDDDNAKINFEVNSYINSQGDEIYHADKQGVRTVAAIRALRNSEITLDNAAGVYGDIIAGRGIANSDATGGKITIKSVEGAEFKGDVLAGNDGVIDLTLNNATYEGRVDDYADATLKDMVFRPEEFDVAVTDGGTVNMTLNNSTWTARGQNFVTKLDFGAEGGLVDLSQDENNSVTIRNLNGNGTFNMLLNSEDHSKSDMLYIGKIPAARPLTLLAA